MNAVIMAIVVMSLVVVRAQVKQWWVHGYGSPPFAFIALVLYVGLVAALLLLPAWNTGDFLAVLRKAWQTAYR
jgi:hypothetical protein